MTYSRPPRAAPLTRLESGTPRHKVQGATTAPICSSTAIQRDILVSCVKKKQQQKTVADYNDLYLRLQDKIEPAHEIMALFVLPKHSSNAHAQSSNRARSLIFCRTLCLLSCFMWVNSEGSGETARMRRLAWAFAGRLCDKYHNPMSWLK